MSAGKNNAKVTATAAERVQILEVLGKETRATPDQYDRNWRLAELPIRTFCIFAREMSSRRLRLSPRPRRVERRDETTDHRVHAAHGPPATALRPPPSGSRPPQRRCDCRHAPRSPSLNGARLAGRGADGRGLPGCGEPHGARAPTGGPEAAATRPEAHRATPARAGAAPNLRVSPYRRASAGRTRQDADPARRGSSARVSPVVSNNSIEASHPLTLAKTRPS